MLSDDQYSDFVIIGGVAAGTKAASVLARRMPKATITLFERSEHISYASCGLPYFASGDIGTFKELLLTPYGVERDTAFFRDVKGFAVHTNVEAVAIDRPAKNVTLRLKGQNHLVRHRYGKLVLATGGLPIHPPFPIPDIDTVSCFTRPEDAIKFRTMAESGKIESAVIIGGGLIGCELAEAVGGLWGIQTTLIEKADRLLPAMLDSEMAAIVERELVRKKVKVIKGANVNGVFNHDGRPSVSIEGGDKIDADYLFLALGIRPNVALASDAGLALGKSGAVMVDKRLRTSDPDIYAGGDCVESVHMITGEPCHLPMGSLANKHGRIIAENLAGGFAENPPVLGNMVVKVFDLSAGAVGLTYDKAVVTGFNPESVWGSFVDKPDYYPDKKSFVLKMIYSKTDDRLLGLQAAGDGDICRRLDVFSALLQKRSTVEDLLDFEHAYAPPFSEALDPLFQMASLAKAGKRGILTVNPSEIPEDHSETVLLDVRETAESSGQPIPETPRRKIINLPLGILRDANLDIDPAAEIFVICKRGPRAYQAVHILRKKGFGNSKIIGGGVQAALD